MKVVGGVYREVCAVPSRDDMVGSGLRAAAVLRSVDTQVELHTVIDHEHRAELDAKLGGLKLAAQVGVRNEPVEFLYFTPLSAPAINGGRSTMSSIEIDCKSALVFRMIESGEIRVRAEAVVLDPQQPRDLGELDLSWIESPRLAIVANRVETLALGGIRDVEWNESAVVEAAEAVRTKYNAEVVVTKLAAQGALVTTAADVSRVGVFPTKSVYPIGSGDVFAAAFAWAWAEADRDPAAAARTASGVAACWCATKHLDLPVSAFAAGRAGELKPAPVRVYLAAPFFKLGERWLVELVRDALSGLGAEVFSPAHDVGVGGDEVARADLEGLEGCQSMLALLDGDDPGTVFEAGWARSRELPVVGFAEHPDAEGGKMLRGSGAEIHEDLATAVYRAIWAGMKRGS